MLPMPKCVFRTECHTIRAGWEERERPKRRGGGGVRERLVKRFNGVLRLARAREFMQRETPV
jgi:hypothetical protein